MAFADFLAAIEHGAASVYHAVLATGAEIIGWESDPAVAPLLNAGAAVANNLLTRTGLGAAATVVTSDVATALKGIAAADPTVPSTGSIGGLVNLAGSIVASIVPGAVPIVAEVAGTVGLAEALANAAAPPAPAA